MKRIQQSRVELLELEGLKQRVAYAFPPPDGKPDSKMNSNVQMSIHAFGRYDDAIVAARKDKYLSPEGVVARTKPLRDAAVKELANAQLRVTIERQRIDAARSTLYAIPRLDPVDAAGAALDREVRERYSALTPVQRDQLVGNLRTGKEDRVLHALLRDPFETPIRQVATAVWTERIERENESEVKQLTSDSEMAEWAESAIRGLGGVLERSRKGFEPKGSLVNGAA